MQNNVAEVLKRIESWSLADLEKLRDALEALFRQQESAKHLYDIRDFRGVGHGTWDEVGGVDEFIRQERASWDEYEKRLEEGRISL